MTSTIDGYIPLYIYHAGQCDSKKCTGKKMARFGIAQLYNRVSRIPRSTIMLNPIAEKALSPADYPGKGIVVLTVLGKRWKVFFPNL